MSGLTLTEQIAQANQGLNYLCLPTPAKILQVAVGNEDYTFGYLINKAYIETEDLELMSILLGALETYENIKLVGNTERVVYNKKNIAHYRQRIFFRNIDEVLSICSDFGLYIYVPNDCRINIHHILGVKQKDLLSLDKYAKKNDLRIDEWLNLTFLYQLYLYFEEKYKGVLTTNALRCCENYLKEIRKPEIISCLSDTTLMYSYLFNSPYYIYNYNLDYNMEALFFWNKTDTLDKTDDLSGYTRKMAMKDYKDIFSETIVMKKEGEA